MAPVSGTFQADFASFYEACRTAQVELRGFESSSRNVEKQVNEMVDSFTGRRIISEATLISDAISKIGGPARLTRAELQRAGAVADEAAEKFLRWGREVPPNILRVQEAARGTNSTLSQTARSIREVDNVLDLFGVHLGPARKAIDDLGYGLEQGTDKLGKVATAGLAVGAGIAGWQIGRAAAEFFKLDEAIGNATAKLLGFGDVAGETAAAKADAMARASKAIGFEVTTYSTALAVNEAAAKAATEANQKLADQLARADAPRKSAEALAKYNAELDQLRKQGLIKALTADVNSHAFSMEELAERYRISAQALSLFGKEAANAERIEKNNADKLKKLAEELRQSQLERIAREKAAEAERLQALYSEIGARTEANAARQRQAIAEAEEQIQARKAVEATTEALRRQKEAADAAARSIGNTLEFDLSTAEGRRRFQQFNPNAQISSAANDEYFRTKTLADAVREGLISFTSQQGIGSSSRQQQFSGSSPGGGGGFGEPRTTQPTGGPGFGGGTAPSGGLPGGLAAAARGGTVVYAPIQVSGVFDPSASHALQGAVGKGLVDNLKTARRLGAVRLG